MVDKPTQEKEGQATDWRPQFLLYLKWIEAIKDDKVKELRP